MALRGNSMMRADELLSDLVALNSENPPGDERAIGAYVEEKLVALDASVAHHEFTPGRPNVVGTIRRGTGPTIVLQSHVDTKPRGGDTSKGWSTDPFALTREGDLLFGLGACDAKGSLAAQLVVLARLAARTDWSGCVELHAAADEEDGSQHGAAAMWESGLLHADAAIVGEPTQCRYVPSQLGNAWAQVTLAGLSAHAGTPSRGRDAVWAAHAFMQYVAADLSGRERDHRFPGHPRLNVGHIRAGRLPGTVPGDCQLLCDIRVLPGQERDEVFDVYSRAARLVEAETGVSCEVLPFQGGGCESVQLGPDTSLEETFADVQRAILGDAEPHYFMGGSDARFYARAGIPVVTFGPGMLEHAHAPDERVSVSELAAAVEILDQVVCLLLSAPPQRPG